ncbi:hypothetical protein SEUCBS139899_004739 [Sporothrix eucalyptigena]
MASQGAVQNFSLPSRTGSRRPFSPSAGDHGSHDGDSDPATSLHADRMLVRSPTPVVTPASSALQLFHFTDDAVARTARRSRILPRPMSTSSSAPALTGTGDGAAAERDGLDVTLVPESHTEVYITDGKTVFSGDDNHDEGEPDHLPGLQQTPNKNKNVLNEDPTSPTLSVWPRPMSVLDTSPTKISQRLGRLQNGGSLRARDGSYNLHDLSRVATTHDADLESNLNNPGPPSLARSISIRWGPRLRHIPLSEVQAADDAARRVASIRRERRVFWFLVGLALVGVLSCTGAVTLAAAQAAMQAGVEEIGPDENGGGPIWDARTLGWLVASLIVCASAAVGIAVATSSRWRRRRDGCVGGAYDPSGEKAMLAQLVQSSTQGRGVSGGRATATTTRERDCGGGSRCSHRFSALFSNREPQHQDADGNTRETRESRAGWVEMNDLDERDEQGRGVVPRWWSLRRKDKENNTAGDYDTENVKEIATNDGNSDGAFINKDLPTPTEVPVPDEDRNWNKFTQDPIQLRRYVETLESRLAVVEGVQRVRNSSGGGVITNKTSQETEIHQPVPQRSHSGVIRSPAMALLPRETTDTPDAEGSAGNRRFATYAGSYGPWSEK